MYQIPSKIILPSHTDIISFQNCFTKSKIVKPIKFSFLEVETVIVPSSHYKIQLLNKYHSIEKTNLKVSSNGLKATYEELALLLFALKNLGINDKYQPLIYNISYNKEKPLSNNIKVFLNEIKKTDNLFIELSIGKNRLPFRFSVKKGQDEIIVETKVYHPNKLSSVNVLKALSYEINKEIELLSHIIYYNI
jgi:hypothetical protein